MRTKSCLCSIAAAFFAATSSSNIVHAQDADLSRLLKADQTEQTAWINAHLRMGMPPSDEFVMLILNRPEITLPLIEQKIEEVLRSPSTADTFADRSVDPQKFIGRAAIAISEAGTVDAMKAASKLIKIDDKRFGDMITDTLIHSESYRNPFVVAYQGFEISEPAIDSRIVAWAELRLDHA